MNKQKIMKEIASNLPALEQNYHVKRLGIFGSVAKGEQKKDSDVDLLVEFSSPIGFFDFIRLENFLSKILKQKIDLVTKNALKRGMKDEIIKETLYV